MAVDFVAAVGDLLQMLPLWAAVLRMHDSRDLVSAAQEVGEHGGRTNRIKTLVSRWTKNDGENRTMLRRIKLYFSHRAKKRKEALIGAAEDGRLDQVKKLLKAGTDPNARCKDGFTALMWAAARGHVDVVAALLQSGAEMHARTRKGRTAIEIAVQEGRTDVAALLQERIS